MVSASQDRKPTKQAVPLSLKNWGDRPSLDELQADTCVDCGWGRVVFGQTFQSPDKIARELLDERIGERNVAFYVHEPHVVISAEPLKLFLDPSHSYRLNLKTMPKADVDPTLLIREAKPDDLPAINRLYLARGMTPLREDYLGKTSKPDSVFVLVAEDGRAVDPILGVVMGVDHKRAFNDPDNGSSLWSLAADEQARLGGIGRALTVALAEHFRESGLETMDLSVIHDNESAIALYASLGFQQVPIYCLKTKNSINEPLFIGPTPDDDLNPYARIIVDEARRRGMIVDIEDAEAGLFRLINGGRSISCRESLSDMTSAVAMSRCDDKSLTRRLLANAGLKVPDQMTLQDEGDPAAFLKRHGRVVVKPARGEQGQAVSVDLRSEKAVFDAIDDARKVNDTVLLEEFVEGQDLRVIVIDGEVVAAAIRMPPTIVGDGETSIEGLIKKLSRRRSRATDGESKIPFDTETHRAISNAGKSLESVLAKNGTLQVRKTANLHTGGTIHDVTEQLNPALAQAAIEAAEALKIPVVGLDMIVTDPAEDYYRFIEANERPGLANHEPQPTAQKFIDLLFPETKTEPNQQEIEKYDPTKN